MHRKLNPMAQISFHNLDALQKKLMLELALGNKKRYGSVSGGMCGGIYVFDQGENVFPRYESKKDSHGLGTATRK